MIKLILSIAILIFAFTCAKAQNSEEWLQQRKTQIKYLKKQIAALQIYIEFAKTGYKIANKGLTTIRNIKNGDFSLHSDFFSSLKKVSPQVKKSANVADIIALQIRIIKDRKATLKNLSDGGQLTAGEMEYCKEVFDRLLDECFKNIEELLQVVTSGELVMKDDERIQKIDRIYLDMQDKLAFNASFGEDALLLSLQRNMEQLEINYSKRLNGFK